MKKIGLLLAAVILSMGMVMAQKTKLTTDEKVKIEMDSLKAKLNLTPEQVAKITPAVKTAVTKQENLMVQMNKTDLPSDFNNQLNNIIIDRNTVIKKWLTPTQISNLPVGTYWIRRR